MTVHLVHIHGYTVCYNDITLSFFFFAKVIDFEISL